ncbi:MAG: hypothetical protein IPN24_11215 [Betaproteobacteria bacterium]|nr:hypothetical protein [Betaproteobacteria bacterium]
MMATPVSKNRFSANGERLYASPYAAPYPRAPTLIGSVGVVEREKLARSATKAADRQSTYAAEGTTLPVIYGQDVAAGKVGGVLAYGTYLWLVVIWCAGECDSIVSVSMNGETVPAGVARYDRLGTATQTVVTELQTAAAARGIVYTDTLPGVCYSVFSVQSLVVDDYPEFTAVIKGRKVKPTSSGTPAWSDNPALCLADFVENTTYGMGRSIDWATVATVQAKCDEVIGGEKRRTLNLSLINEQFVEAWLDTLRAYAGCWISNEGGVIRLIADAASASVYSFDATNIADGSLRLRKSGLVDIPTVMRVTYTDTTTTPYRDGEAVAYAAGVLAGTTPWRESIVPLPGINRYSQANREAIERLNALTLSDLQCEFGAFDVGLKLLLGERITVTHPIGLTAKDFRIVAISDDGFGRYTIAGAEYDAAQWSDVVVSTPTTVDSGLVASGTPPTLTGLAAVEEIYRTGDGLISSRLRITWTDPAWPSTLNYLVAIYEVSTLIHTGTAWDEIYVSPALQEGKSYRVDVAIISKAGVAGTAVSTSISMVGKIGTLPGDVPAFEATEAGGKVYARWSAATDLDTLDYELRYGAVGVSWDAATYINRLASLAYVIEGIPAGEWDFLIKARDSYKQYSATEAEKTLTVTLDANATLIGNFTFPSGTLTAMVLGVVADLDRWDTDNGDGWGYGHTDTNNATGSWTDASAIVNTAWATQTSATTIRWASDVWDLGQIMAVTVTTNLTAQITEHAGTPTYQIGYSLTNAGGSYVWTEGGSATVVARYIKVRVNATPGSVTVQGPVTGTATGVVRRESGTTTTSASAAVSVQLTGSYAQFRAIQLTAQGTAAMQPVYDRVLLHPEAGLMLTFTLSGSGNVYQTFSTLDRVVVTDDTFHCEIYVPADTADDAATFGIRATYTDVTTGLVPITPLVGGWVTIDSGLVVGKTLDSVQLYVVSTVAGAHKVILRDARITDGGSTTRVTYYASGEPSANTTVSSSAASAIQMGPTNAFLVYCFDGTNAQVANTISYTFEGA